MADYVYLDDYSKKGALGISYHAFDELVTKAISRVKGVSVSNKKLKKNQTFKLNRPIQTYIRHDIVHVRIAVDVAKGNDLQKVIRNIQDEVINTLVLATEQVPFDVQVKVESII